MMATTLMCRLCAPNRVLFLVERLLYRVKRYYCRGQTQVRDDFKELFCDTKNPKILLKSNP